MWFWLTTITLIIAAIILFATLGPDNYGYGFIPLGIAVILLLSLVAAFSTNCQIMNRGTKLAQSVLDSKFYDAKLEGNLIKVSAFKFDINNLEGLNVVKSLLEQADYVDYNTYANQHGWLNVFHPDPEKPLLKIEIVKTP